ncbi:MAG: two-component system, OmpR family, sensor histidine kinase BaeS [Solirubrobacteraceae bacterium]|nr:two-component system, OmpR family, sensor histidine kinase BaeS [Solirubrobacteraceae bacterium]
MRAYLLGAMVTLALSSVAATALLINRAVDAELATFAERDLQLAADDAAETAAALYIELGRWSSRSVTALRAAARSRNGTISLLGADGHPLAGSASARAAAGRRAAIVVRGRTVGTVVATRSRAGPAAGPITRLDRRLHGRMDGLLLESGFVAGILALIIASALALRMARPLERLTEVARRMEGGHIEARATGSGGGREMTRLAHTMDRLAAALRRQDELRRATAADVTHELRSALVGVVARIETLQDGVADDPAAVLRRMQGDVRRVHRLVDDVDLLVDAQQPSLLVDRQPLALDEVVRAAVERSEHECAARGIRLTASVAPVQVAGDTARLAQVVDNLLSNAVRYTDPGGRVAVRVRGRGDAAVIEVADSGIGIAPDHVPRVFDRFWRAGAAAERAPDGSGVGLAVVAEIVAAHGGSVRVDSRPAAGTTFTVLLALAAPAAAVPGAAPARNGAPAGAAAQVAASAGSVPRTT